MATTMVPLEKDKWVEVSTVSVLFQMPDQVEAYAIEASAAPADKDTTIRKKIIPGEIYSFQKLDGNLYMISLDNDSEVAIEPAS